MVAGDISPSSIYLCFLSSSEGDILAVEMKDLFTRYTNDVIATSAFGIECDSLNNPKNEFYEMGKDVTNFGGVRALIFFGYMMSPKLMKVRISILYPQYSLNAVKYQHVPAVRAACTTSRPSIPNLLHS
jgi:hypothetical protein